MELYAINLAFSSFFSPIAFPTNALVPAPNPIEIDRINKNKGKVIDTPANPSPDFPITPANIVSIKL